MLSIRRSSKPKLFNIDSGDMACISIEDTLFVELSRLLQTSEDEAQKKQDDFNADSGAWNTPEAGSDVRTNAVEVSDLDTMVEFELKTRNGLSVQDRDPVTSSYDSNAHARDADRQF